MDPAHGCHNKLDCGRWLLMLLVGKSGLKKLIAAFDLTYEVPSKNYFSRTGTPALYVSTREIVSLEIPAAKFVCFFLATTDKKT